MNNRYLGIALLILASGLFYLAGNLTVVKCVLLLLLFYNWTLGRQRGHFLHMIIIVAAFLLALMSYLQLRAGILSESASMMLAIFLLVAVTAIIFAKKNEIIKFYRDHSKGVERDHFK